MLDIRVITIDDAVKPKFRHHINGTSGIYALVDPETHIPRYVGSSQHIECRLYEHVTAGGYYRGNSEKHAWVTALRDRGLFPVAWVLEEVDVGPRQDPSRLSAERKWVEVCAELFGGADLNRSLTPAGHVTSKDSPGKLMRLEMIRMGKRIAELESELAIRSGFGVQHCNASNVEQHVARCAAPDPSTQRTAGL